MRTLVCSPLIRRSNLNAFLATLACLAVLLPPARRAWTQTESSIAELHRNFAEPPDSSRIMMRWWWFGPAAVKPEITRELEEMKAAGIGGVEIASLYPLELDDPATGFHNTPFLSKEHLDTLSFAAHEARRLGLRVDITLGSGWPFGGPEIPVTQAASKLRVEKVDVAPGSTIALAPHVEAGEQRIEAFLVAANASPEQLSQAQPLASPITGRYVFSASTQHRQLVAFIASRTGMTVKRASIGAEGFVLDHYDPIALVTHLRTVGDRLLSAFGNEPPYAVFCDSLEDYGSDWTPALLDEFQRRRGYDLRPHLLALVMQTPGRRQQRFVTTGAARLPNLPTTIFWSRMQAWARKHHTLLRSQTYGFPPVTLCEQPYRRPA